MSETQIIPWKRLAIEATAIVGSILLAFAIDAWWDDRQERQFEQETLIGLKAEYQDHKQDVERQNEFHLTSLRAIASLMASCRSGKYESVEFAIDVAFFYFVVPSTTDLGNGVRDALISAGRIEVLTDKQLRYELARWDSVLDELTDGQEFSRHFVRETIYPQLIRMGRPLSKAYDNENRSPWPIPTQSISNDLDENIEFLTDPEFCGILDIRYGNMIHTADEFDDVILAIDSILARIDLSLEN